MKSEKGQTLSSEIALAKEPSKNIRLLRRPLQSCIEERHSGRSGGVRWAFVGQRA